MVVDSKVMKIVIRFHQRIKIVQQQSRFCAKYFGEPLLRSQRGVDEF